MSKGLLGDLNTAEHTCDFVCSQCWIQCVDLNLSIIGLGDVKVPMALHGHLR